MKERNINQKALAEIANVSKSVISDWLKSDSSPHNLNAVLRLCKSLQIDFQWLTTGEHSAPNLKEISLSELFDLSDEPEFTGIFQIEMKRLKRKKVD